MMETYKHWIKYHWVTILLIVLFGCTAPQQKKLNEGHWRGIFEVDTNEIPFNFSVSEKDTGEITVTLHNAHDAFHLDKPYWERDSLVVPIEIFDAYLIGRATGDLFEGYFRKNQENSREIPFTAIHNKKYRFGTEDGENTPTENISGKWSVSFYRKEGDPNRTVGVFEQKGKEVTGSILTTTGDYRYLQGIVNGDSLKLSSFSGSSPVLLHARFLDSENVEGILVNTSGSTAFSGKKDDDAVLADPYSLTYLNEGYEKLDFTFPDLTGKEVSLSDQKYQDKVVIVTLMGSWCPNCMDEAAFLAPWYLENKHRGVEIIALGFERKDEFEFAKERLGKFVDRLDVEYDVLFAGRSDKTDAAKKLPALNTVFSFPTTILIDREGNVRKIHTGFYGPATGKYYEEFVQEFNQAIDELLTET